MTKLTIINNRERAEVINFKWRLDILTNSGEYNLAMRAVPNQLKKCVNIHKIISSSANHSNFFIIFSFPVSDNVHSFPKSLKVICVSEASQKADVLYF
jgi:hypothetical protein